jgi:N-methylhydantoinase A
VYERSNIKPNERFKGPAIIEDPTSTVLVLGSQVFNNDKFGNIIIRSRGDRND